MSASFIPMMNLSGHTFVKNGDLWVSRAPFTNMDWQSNAGRLRADHRQFGVLTETRVGNKVKYSLDYLSTLATLRDMFGTDLVQKNFGGTDVVWDDHSMVSAFEFFLLKGIGDCLRHPVTYVTYPHAQGMCLAIGADLMTDDQYVKVVSGRSGKRQHATPNGELYGPNGEEYVVSSIKKNREGTVDVEDPEFPTDPETGTRHYTGNVWKWMKKNPQEKYKFGVRGGSWSFVYPGDFDASSRSGCAPEDGYDGVGFLVALPTKDLN